MKNQPHICHSISLCPDQMCSLAQLSVILLSAFLPFVCNAMLHCHPHIHFCHPQEDTTSSPLSPTHSLPSPRRHHTFTTATHTFTPKKTPRCSKHSLVRFHNPLPRRKMFFYFFLLFFSAQPLVATQV